MGRKDNISVKNGSSLFKAETEYDRDPALGDQRALSTRKGSTVRAGDGGDAVPAWGSPGTVCSEDSVTGGDTTGKL